MDGEVKEMLGEVVANGHLIQAWLIELSPDGLLLHASTKQAFPRRSEADRAGQQLIGEIRASAARPIRQVEHGAVPHEDTPKLWRGYAEIEFEAG